MFPETGKSVRMPRKYTFLRRQPTTWRQFLTLCKYMKISTHMKAKIMFETF